MRKCIVEGSDESKFFESKCKQQSKGFECGIYVLVNAKFVDEGYCRRVKPGCASFQNWYNSFQLTVAEDVDVCLPVVQVLKSAPLYSGPHSQSLRTDIGDCSNEVEHKNNSPIDTKKKSIATVKNINKSSSWVRVKSNSKHACPLNKNIVAQSSFNHKNKYNVLRDVEHCENVDIDISPVVIKKVSGKWKVSNSKRAKHTSASRKSEEGPAEAPLVLQEQFSVNERKAIESRNGGISKRFDTLSDCLIIGDSILKYSARQCADSGATIDCNPGAKILHIKQKFLGHVKKNPKVIYLHVGTNNLMKGFCGGKGYNGGWGKREMLNDMADLLSTARRTFPGSKIILNSILYRADISDAALIDLNDQLQLMCWNFGVRFVKTWHFISRRHLAKDGRHLSRYGNRCLGYLMLRTLRKVHCGGSEPPAGGQQSGELSLENSETVLPDRSATSSSGFLEPSRSLPSLT